MNENVTLAGYISAILAGFIIGACTVLGGAAAIAILSNTI